MPSQATSFDNLWSVDTANSFVPRSVTNPTSGDPSNTNDSAKPAKVFAAENKKDALSQHAILELKSEPLFLFKEKVAYDHDFKFSHAGREFVAVSQLPIDTMPHAYEFVTSIYPEHAAELERNMMEYWGKKGVEWLTQFNQKFWLVGLGRKPGHEKISSSLENLLQNITDPKELEYYVRIHKLTDLQNSTAPGNENTNHGPESAKTLTGTTFLSDHRHQTQQKLPLSRAERHQLPSSNAEITIVNSHKSLENFFEILAIVPNSEKNAQMCCCGIGNNYDKLYFLVIYVPYVNHTYHVDLIKLGAVAFHGQRNTYYPTLLRKYLEDPKRAKIVFNGGYLANALYMRHRVTLGGTFDIEIAACILGKKSKWLLDTALKHLWAPSCPGWDEWAKYRYLRDVFASRPAELADGPLKPALREFANCEARVLSDLYLFFCWKLTVNELSFVKARSDAVVNMAIIGYL